MTEEAAVPLSTKYNSGVAYGKTLDALNSCNLSFAYNAFWTCMGQVLAAGYNVHYVEGAYIVTPTQNGKPGKRINN